jgi:hypothetical protein
MQKKLLFEQSKKLFSCIHCVQLPCTNNGCVFITNCFVQEQKSQPPLFSPTERKNSQVSGFHTQFTKLLNDSRWAADWSKFLKGNLPNPRIETPRPKIKGKDTPNMGMFDEALLVLQEERNFWFQGQNSKLSIKKINQKNFLKPMFFTPNFPRDLKRAATRFLSYKLKPI